MEAASGLEPLSRGFADLRLNHLATPPRKTRSAARFTIGDSAKPIKIAQADAHLARSDPRGLPPLRVQCDNHTR
jgi:hypothetical protein